MSNGHPSDQDYEIAIIGAGLAGGLIALALIARKPDIRLLLIDGADRAGGNHMWSFFDSDVSDEGRALLAPLVTHRWERGHQVRFPGYDRAIDIAYNSIASRQFDAHVRATLGNRLRLNQPVKALSSRQVTLANGETLAARAIIDARGFPSPVGNAHNGTKTTIAHSTEYGPAAYSPDEKHAANSPAPLSAGSFLRDDEAQADAKTNPVSTLACGWQKFVGQTLRLSSPHSLNRPIIMDVRVDQLGGYRFVYVLPTGPQEIFVEDTYYTDGPQLDIPTVRARITEYAAAQGWQIEAVEHEETGVLPVVKAGDFARFWPGSDTVARAGVRAGLFHPTTGYSLPMAVDFALALADAAPMDGMALGTWARNRAAQHWRSGGYYRMLDTMLFDAAPPEERYRIFERFYQLPEPLIMRFYAGRSSFADKIRILCGKPPVRIRAAIRAIITRNSIKRKGV